MENRKGKLVCFYLFVIFISAFLLVGRGALAGVESEKVEIMPLSEVKKGMIGVGKTVVEGTTIEEFKVEVIGIFQGTDLLSSYILVRVSGDAIERSGGISAGMSGSPVYIDGKLVGAISYRYPESDHRVGLLTPAEEMLKLLKYDGGAVASPGDRSKTVALQGRSHNFVPIQTPVLISGMGERAFRILEREFGKRGLKALRVPAAGGPTGSSSPSSESLPVEPGSAIGVQLVQGAINIVAVGTVTYKEGATILSFGHPFLNAGAVNFFASSIYIHSTIQSNVMPFKIASPLRQIGTVTQDRGAGLVAILDKEPPSVAARLTVVDRDNKREKTFYFQLVRDPILLPELLGASFLQGIDYTIDRLGQGTAEVSFYVRTRDGAGSFSRENIFYSDFDVAAASLSEMIEDIAALLNNDIVNIEIIDVGAQINIRAEQRTARIVRACVEEENPLPGSEVVVKVDLKPYRGDIVTIPVKLRIPEGTPPGAGVVSVYAGGESLYDAKYHSEEWSAGGLDAEKDYDYKVRKDLKEFVNDLVTASKNNEILVEFQSYCDESEGSEPLISPNEKTPKDDTWPDIEQKPKVAPTELKNPRVVEPSEPQGRGSGVGEDRGLTRVVVATDFVLSGWTSLDITVGGGEAKTSGQGVKPSSSHAYKIK